MKPDTMSTSSSTSSTATSRPKRIHKKPSVKQVEAMNMLRRMVGCDNTTNDYELLQKIMEHITRLRHTLESDEDSGIELEPEYPPSSITNVLQQLCISKQASSKS